MKLPIRDEATEHPNRLALGFGHRKISASETDLHEDSPLSLPPISIPDRRSDSALTSGRTAPHSALSLLLP